MCPLSEAAAVSNPAPVRGCVQGVLAVEDQPRPELVSPTEVLVRVKAATVDRVDLRIASGYGRTLRRQVNRYNPVRAPPTERPGKQRRGRQS